MLKGSAIPRGKGRPAGALNKSTSGWRDYWLAQHGSPVEKLLRIGMMPVDTLAAELECSLLEAAKIQVIANDKAAPYIHQRLAQIEVVDKRGIPLDGDDATVIDGTSTVRGGIE